MSKTYEEILAGANTIKNERSKGANSASRIGQQFVDQAEYAKDVADRTTDLELKIEDTNSFLFGNSQSGYEEIEKVDGVNFFSGQYYQTNANNKPARKDLASVSCMDIPCKEGDKFRIFGNGGSSIVLLFYCFYRGKEYSESTIVEAKPSGAIDGTNGYEITAPEGAESFIVNFSSYNKNTDKLEKYIENVNDGFATETNNRLEHLEGSEYIIGKKVVCFGDSLTEYEGIDGKRYSDWIADMTGADVINVGIGGSMIRQRAVPTATPTDSKAYSGLDMLTMVESSCSQDFAIPRACAQWIKENLRDDNTAIVERLASIDWSNVDVVTLFGGTNDFNNAHSLGTSGEEGWWTTLGAFNKIVRLLLTTYPHIKLYYFTPAVRWAPFSGDAERTNENWCDVRYNTDESGEHKTLVDYVDALIEEARKNKIPVCDMYRTLGWNQFNFSQYFPDNDGTHPTKGFKQIAEKIIKFIESN